MWLLLTSCLEKAVKTHYREPQSSFEMYIAENTLDLEKVFKLIENTLVTRRKGSTHVLKNPLSGENIKCFGKSKHNTIESFWSLLVCTKLLALLTYRI